MEVSVVNASNNRYLAGFVMTSLACVQVRVQQRFSPLSLLFQRVKIYAAYKRRSIF